MAVTYDFQTPGVSTSAADTQEDIRNIAEMSWVWHVNASPHSLTNKPTGLIEAFYDSTVDFTSSIPAYGYQNYYSLKAYDGTNLGNVNFMQLYVHNDGAVLSNTVGTRGQEFISMGSTAGYSCQSLAPWTINADVGNSGTSTYDPILAFQNQSVERARIYTDTSDSHKLKFDVGGSDQMVIDSSGNVGIGTSSPSSKLEVDGSIQVTAAPGASSGKGLELSGNSSLGEVLAFDRDGVGALTLNLRGETVNLQSGSLGADTAIHIDSSQNVGIGTSSPQVQLESAGELRIADGASTGNGSFLSVKASDAEARIVSSYYGAGSYKPLAFWTGGSERLQIDSSGNVEVNNGNLVIGTSGKGIDFSATSDVAGATSELLDDYEEGTFTPVIYYRDLSANGGLGADASFSISSYTAQAGTYTKIGDTVRINIRIKTNTLSGGDPTDEVRISGLPFVASSDIASYPVTILSQDFSANPPDGAAVIGGDDVIYLYRDASSTSALTKLQVSDLSGGSNNNDILITGLYYI